MFDIPSSVVKTNCEWNPKVHKGYWCLVEDVKNMGKTFSIVVKASKNPENLYVYPKCYLISPEGKRLSN